MIGRAAVHSHKQRIDAAFKRASAIESDFELQADFACYLCILISGFLEKATQELLQEYCHGASSPAVRGFVERQLKFFTNLNREKLLQLLGHFDQAWRAELDEYIVDEREAAVNSIVDLRNQVAHGRSVGVTYLRAKAYWGPVCDVIGRIEQVCLA